MEKKRIGAIGRATAYAIALAGLYGAMGSMQTHSSVERVLSAPDPHKPIPKGCKEYFFNQWGRFSTDKMRKDECVFICVASNDKSAIKKFNKWQKNTES